MVGEKSEPPLYQRSISRATSYKRQHRARVSVESLSDWSDAGRLLYPPIYSLREAQFSLFTGKTTVIGLHIVSILSRFVAGLGVLLLVALTSLSSWKENRLSGIVLPESVSHFVSQLNLARILIGSVTGVVLLATGALGTWTICNIRFKGDDKYLKRYFIETVSLRVSLIVSILHLGSAFVIGSLIHNAFCEPQSIVGYPTEAGCHRRQWIIVEAVFTGLTVIAGLFPLQLWLGKAFKFYTVVAFLRYALGVGVLAVTLETGTTLRAVKMLPGYVSLDTNTAYQLALLRSLTRAHGCVSGTVSIVTSMYSIIAGYYRSTVLTGVDVLVVFFAFWGHATVIFGMNWIFSILQYLKNYESIYGTTNNTLETLFSVGIKMRYVSVCVLESLTLVALFTVFFVTSLNLTMRRFKPLEWTAPERLVMRLPRRRRPSLKPVAENDRKPSTSVQ